VESLTSASKQTSINCLPSASSVLPRALNNSLPPPESGSPEAESRVEAWAYNQFIFHGALDARAAQRCNWIESLNLGPTSRGFDLRAIA
jgi:hypothetical protein